MTRFALLFPGQGSQYVGMGKASWERDAQVRSQFEMASDVLGLDMKKLCFDSELETLTETHNAQVAIFLCSLANYTLYKQEVGIVPQFAAGHSLGELTALTCAGALDIRDALRIIRQRGLLMKDAVAPGAGRMSAVIGVPAAKIDEVCQAISTAAAPVAVANLNTPKQTVISGAAAAVEAAGRELEQLGAKVVSLKVSGPFHCPLMQPAAERFAQVWKGVPLRPLAFPVVSNVTAFLYREAADVPDMLSRQLLNPVRWNDSMQFLRNQNVDVFIDVGPGSILKRMVSESEIPGTVFSLDLDADRAALRSLKESQYVGVITRCMAAAVCTRNQNFDDQEYRLGVIEPYRQLEHLHETLDESKRQPTEHEMRDAVALLKKILTTKKLSRDELEGRVERIFDETGTRGLLA